MFNGIIEPLDIQKSDEGCLKNITFVAKDLLDVKGLVTGGGNPDWKRTHSEALQNSPAIEALLDEGARLTGKTVTDELAFSLDGLNMHFAIPHNPNFEGSIPGGSSSGSAAAVANGICDLALGTDTAGSIRVPAAYCGIYGMRPTHGRISLEGTIPLGTTFDTIGWMSRSLDLMSITGSVLLKEKCFEPQLRQIALLQDGLDLLEKDWHQSFLQKWRALSDMSVTMSDLSEEAGLDSFSQSFNHARGFEAWRAHGKWYEEVHPRMNPSIEERFLACATISEQDYHAALEKRKHSIERVNKKLQDLFVLLPTIQKAPPKLDASEDELLVNRKANILLNSLASFCGLPQISLPYRHENHKFALSLVGPQGSDMELLALAIFIERSGILA